MAVYYVPFTGTLTNAGGNADLLEVSPADDKPCRLRGMILSQTSEVADAAEEIIQLSIIRMTATVTSGNGTAVTPVATRTTGIAAAGFAAECNGATVATTTGATTIIAYIGWNLRQSPCEIWFPDPDTQPQVVQGEALLVRCDSTVADDVTVQLTFVIEEC